MALRNLYRRRKRYALISAAVAIGFVLITFITSLAYGSMSAVKDKAARYFAGHASVTAYGNSITYIKDPQKIISVLHNSALPIRTISRRVSYNYDDAVLFFNGETVRQRKLAGVDFQVEGKEFSSLSFLDGSSKIMETEAGKNGILISVPAARILGCRVGDDLTLHMRTDSGQYNTSTLFVRGIFNETSIFGYIAYMRLSDLNGLLVRPLDSASDIAVYAKENTDTEIFSEHVRVELAKNFKVFPRFYSRAERDSILLKGIQEETLSVLSPNAQLAQISQLLDALLLIAYLTLGIFSLVVSVGILNTWRVLVYERTREIGAMRAMGMQQGKVRLLFLLEAGFLALFSSGMGLIIAWLILMLVGWSDYSSLPGAGMFLEAGHFRFQLQSRVIGLNILIMLAATLLAAWGPSRRASRIRPVDAMRDNA